MRKSPQVEMTTAHPGVSVGHEVNLNLNPDTEQDHYLTATPEVDPEVLHIRIGREAIQEAEAEAGIVEIGQEVEVVPTTVTRVVVEPIVEADREVVPMVITADPVGHTRMIVTIAEAEVEVKGVTAIGDLEVTIGDPDRMALTVRVIAVTPTTEVPVKAVGIAENLSVTIETVFNKFVSVMFKTRTVLRMSQVKLKDVY